MEQYIDACELIKDTEKEIRRLEKQRKTIHTDSVKGSLSEFPYTPTTIKIQGVAYSVVTEPRRLEMEQELLEERKAAAQAIKLQVEEWMNGIPSRMQRIIRYSVFEGLSWNEVAIRMGRKATADSVRMEYNNFMKKS